MKIYFLSAQPCALTVNETYFGRTDLFERTAELSLKERLFIRFTPENALPISFFLTENIRFSPPEGCEVYLLADGLAIYARDFPPRDFTLTVIAQERRENTLVTVFRQGRVQVSVQTEKNFFVAYLPPSFSVCKILFQETLIVLQASDAFAVFDGDGKRLLQEQTLSFTADGAQLSAVLPLSDSLGRVADCTWEVSNGALVQTKFSLRQARDRDGGNDERKIREELLPYALFEGVKLGAEIGELLSEELREKADSLREFIGEYETVALTPDPYVCAVIRKKAERLFEASYYRVDTQDGRITDIREA